MWPQNYHTNSIFYRRLTSAVIYLFIFWCHPVIVRKLENPPFLLCIPSMFSNALHTILHFSLIFCRYSITFLQWLSPLHETRVCSPHNSCTILSDVFPRRAIYCSGSCAQSSACLLLLVLSFYFPCFLLYLLFSVWCLPLAFQLHCCCWITLSRSLLLGYDCDYLILT